MERSTVQLADKSSIVQRLQSEVLSMQGYRAASNSLSITPPIGPLEAAFPQHTFPTGAIHEFVSHRIEDASATSGFMAGLWGQLVKDKPCLWVSTKRTLFPSTLKSFNIEPSRIIFVDATKVKDALWTIEEGLKCKSLGMVIGELSELTFTQSRRLQLAVQESHVTGFIHRYQPRNENTVACVTRWKIRPIPSVIEDGMPGVGLPRWQVQLLKVRNGKPATWEIEWSGNQFRYISKQLFTVASVHKRQTA